jgi:predicted peptidase
VDRLPTKQSFSRELRIAVEGEYYVQTPTHSTPPKPPLLIFLHGVSQADTLFELEAPPRIALERGLPLVVVSPLCTETRWNVDAVLALIEEVLERHPVDRGRIYASGVSIGGLATWELALRRPDLLAAIAPICGAGQPWNAFRIAHLPTWIFHGGADEVVPASVSSEMAAALRAAGGEPRLTIYPDEGHRVWSRAYAEPGLWKWLLDQTAAGQPTPSGAPARGGFPASTGS